MADKLDNKPIIIKKISNEEDCAHGGAWKIAFADLMTAVMAFFMLLWVLGSTSEEDKKVIAEYFRDPTIFEGQKEQIVPEKNLGRTNSVMDAGGQMDTPKTREGNKEENEVKTVDMDQLLQSLSEQLGSEKGIKVEAKDEGIDVMLYDEFGRSFFELGSSQLTDEAIDLVDKFAQKIQSQPLSLSIVGHTDALKFKKQNYDNFDLSIDRAQSIRRSLIEKGLSVDQFDLITGVADRELMQGDGLHPYSAKQRRVVINIKPKKD